MLPWSAAFREGTVMKKLLGSIALLAMAMPLAAQAADLPPAPAYKAPAYVPEPVATWTGFYVGLNAGGARNDTTYSTYPTGCYLTGCAGGPPLNSFRSASGTFNDLSFTGGGQAGFNWQTGMVVWGVEADLQWKGENETISQTIALPAPPFAVGNFLNTTSDKMDWFGTVRGRLGFLATPSLLLYGTGGLAYGEVQSATTNGFTATPDIYSGSIDTIRPGWTAGAGAEWMFAPNWSAKAEYLYVDLGTVSYTSTCSNNPGFCGLVPAPTYQTDVRVRDNIFRFGVNYHFGGPVVARY
jgi:outer membrane immunogenic protein